MRAADDAVLSQYCAACRAKIERDHVLVISGRSASIESSATWAGVMTHRSPRHVRVHRVPIADVIAFGARNKLIGVHTRDGKRRWIEDSIARLAEELGDEWMRVHRGWIVRISAIEAIEMAGDSAVLTLTGGLTVPVSRRLRGAVMRVLQA